MAEKVIIKNIENVEVKKAYEVWSPTGRRLGAYLITEIIGSCFCCTSLDYDYENGEYLQTDFETSFDMSDGIFLYPISESCTHMLFEE